MLQIAHLIALIDAYKSADPVEDKTLSFRVFGDSKKIAALREGGGIEVKRFNGAFAWFDQHWPATAVWPAEVPRPQVAA